MISVVEVLNLGRKVRLATTAQRKAILARYSTCWVKHCPLPATWCQIDHLNGWADGGPTDLANLGPCCQFHNRDRYRHPERYTPHRTGPDTWKLIYQHPIFGRRTRRTTFQTTPTGPPS